MPHLRMLYSSEAAARRRFSAREDEMLPVVCAVSLMNESRPTRMVPAPHAGFLQAPMQRPLLT